MTDNTNSTMGPDRHDSVAKAAANGNGKQEQLVVQTTSSAPTLDVLRRSCDRLYSGVGRRVGMFALRCLGSTTRAQVLERCCDEMIVEVPIASKVMSFYAPTPLLRWRAKSAISKEPDTINWISRFREGAVFWDVGANIGVFSLYAGIHKCAAVLSFEPAAENYHILCRNIQLNHFPNKVMGLCVAFAGTTRLGFLNLSALAAGSATHQFGALGEKSRFMDVGTEAGSHGMCGFTIDAFIELFKPAFPEHIKIDVDGIEADILGGARHTLNDPRLRSLMVELDVDDTREVETVLSLIEPAGFHLVSQGEIQGFGREHSANHLFEKA